MECLESLVRQSIPIAIHLSISFESPDLKDQTIASIMSNQELKSANRITLHIKSSKTPQMRHIQYLVNELAGVHEWIMFSDDDDTYEPNRALHFANIIAKGIQEIGELNKSSPDDPKQFVGIYESTFGKEHREQRHEYWCYCVHIQLLVDFYAKLSKYPDIIDDRCCDVLFGEYLRRSAPNKLFVRVTEPFYNYRVENNSDSVTGFIKTNQPKFTNLEQAPPRERVQEWADYVVYWNGYLYENMDVYIHDTYLRTLVGSDLDYILRAEFMANYSLIDFVDACHVQKIADYHHRLRAVCNELYDIPL
jgi:glycosyltransferase involved in cell wall biosynthesis